MLDRDYAAPWLMFNLLSKEHRNLIQKYYYYPTQSKFLQIKKILEKAEPDPAILEEECYKDFLKTLPKLKNSFVARFVINSENLEKI
jgi:hypothetical protein